MSVRVESRTLLYLRFPTSILTIYFIGEILLIKVPVTKDLIKIEISKDARIEMHSNDNTCFTLFQSSDTIIFKVLHNFFLSCVLICFLRQVTHRL